MVLKPKDPRFKIQEFANHQVAAHFRMRNQVPRAPETFESDCEPRLAAASKLQNECESCLAAWLFFMSRYTYIGRVHSETKNISLRVTEKRLCQTCLWLSHRVRC